ncbi:hypothetical protein PENTCL1PPCAC_8718, partial [Pristionchus entomophagus]
FSAMGKDLDVLSKLQSYRIRRLKFLVKLSDKVPRSTTIYQTDDGTVFYRKVSSPQRLYVKSIEKEFDAKLPGDIQSAGAFGNALYFISSRKVYKAEATPSNEIKISCLREMLKGETINMKICKRVINGWAYVYRMCDDPDRDQILLASSDDELKDLSLELIHRGKLIYISRNLKAYSPVLRPAVRTIGENAIVIEIPHRDMSLFAQNSSPLIYFEYAGINISVLDIETMQFRPLMHIAGPDSINRIAGVYNGMITVNASVNKEDYVMNACLPSGYFKHPDPIKELKVEMQKMSVRSEEVMHNELTLKSEITEQKERNHAMKVQIEELEFALKNAHMSNNDYERGAKLKETEKVQLQNRNEELRKRNRELAQEKDRIHEINEDLKSQLRTRGSTEEHFADMLKSAELRTKDTEIVLKEVNETNKELEYNRKKNEEKMRKLNNTIDDLTKKNSELTGEKEQLRNREEVMKFELNEKSNALQTQKSEQTLDKDRIKRLKERLETLTEAANLLRVEKSELSLEKERIRILYEASNVEIVELQKKIEQQDLVFEGEKDRMRDVINEANEKLDLANKMISELENTISNFSDENSRNEIETSAKLHEIQQNEMALKAKLNEEKERNHSMKMQVDEMNITIGALRIEISDLSHVKERLQKASNDESDELKQANSKIAELQSELSEQMEEYEQSTMEMSLKLTELNNAKHALSSQNFTLTEESEQMRQRCEEMESEITQLKKAISSQEQPDDKIDELEKQVKQLLQEKSITKKEMDAMTHAHTVLCLQISQLTYEVERFQNVVDVDDDRTETDTMYDIRRTINSLNNNEVPAAILEDRMREIAEELDLAVSSPNALSSTTITPIASVAISPVSTPPRSASPIPPPPPVNVPAESSIHLQSASRSDLLAEIIAGRTLKPVPTPCAVVAETPIPTESTPPIPNPPSPPAPPPPPPTAVSSNLSGASSSRPQTASRSDLLAQIIAGRTLKPVPPPVTTPSTTNTCASAIASNTNAKEISQTPRPSGAQLGLMAELQQKQRRINAGAATPAEVSEPESLSSSPAIAVRSDDVIASSSPPAESPPSVEQSSQSAITDQFVGKWNNITSENVDAYLYEIGVGMLTRKLMSRQYPTLTFKVNGDDWTLTSISAFMTHDTKFKLGREFTQHTLEGRDVTCKIDLEGTKLVQTEKDTNGGKDARIESSISGDSMTIVAECNGVK